MTATLRSLRPWIGILGLLACSSSGPDTVTDPGGMEEEEVPAGPLEYRSKLLADDGAANLTLGHDVAVHGDFAAIGTRTGSPGSVYIFARNRDVRRGEEEWTQVVEITRFGGFFGAGVSLDDDRLAIGSSDRTYVYRRTTDVGDEWEEETNIFFGGPIALDGDRLLIGHAVEPARVYERTGTTWISSAALDPGDVAPDDDYGATVALDGDVAVIAARRDDDAGLNAGAVYVYRFNGDWQLEQKLVAADPHPEDWFGHDVAVEGNLILVGVMREDVNGDNAGAACVFIRTDTGWTQSDRLTADGGQVGDLFGGSVSVSEGELLVGASNATSNGRSGSAYHFTRVNGGWEQRRLVALTGGHQDGVGASVALHHGVAVLGAPGDDDQGNGSGSAHVFSR